MVDRRTLNITARPVVCRLASQNHGVRVLQGHRHRIPPGEFTIAVSISTIPRTFRFGMVIDQRVRNRMLIALAVFRDETPITEFQLQDQLARLDAEKPET